MKRYLSIAIICLISLSILGCTSKNRGYERSALDMDWTVSANVKDNINQSINDIADQLLVHSRISIKDNIAITAFVDLHQLNKTTHFGRKISESLFNELHVRGMNVVDVRGTKNIRLNADGEFFITRDIKQLHGKNVENSYILIGTYSKLGKGILLNARIVDNISGVVITTARSIIDINACEIYENCNVVREKEKPVNKTMMNKRTIGLSDAGCSYVQCPSNCVTSRCYNSPNKYTMGKNLSKERSMGSSTQKCCRNSIPKTLHTK